MNVKQVVGIIVIVVIISIGWFILAGAMKWRTNEYGEMLKGRVVENWGSMQVQNQPFLRYQEKSLNDENKVVTTTYTIDPAASDLDVDLSSSHRRKGLIWYAFYEVDFEGTYTMVNTSGKGQVFTFVCPLPATEARYYNFGIFDGDNELELLDESGLAAKVYLKPGESKDLTVRYTSLGQDEWRYSFSDYSSAGRLRNFKMVMHTDFDKIDFPEESLSPGEKVQRDNGGWDLIWEYDSLMSGLDIAMAIPNKLQPGEIVSRITFFAPVCLIFFFAMIVILTLMKDVKLHVMHYVFLALGFFAFHMLLAYLVDHVNLYLAFGIASIVSIFLNVSYLRLVVGPKFAFVWVGLGQLLYLVLFSFSFFFEGFSGITITIGAVITLFVIMQVTAKVDWKEKFKKPESSTPEKVTN